VLVLVFEFRISNRLLLGPRTAEESRWYPVVVCLSGHSLRAISILTRGALQMSLASVTVALNLR
jgi:hypothetical protein